MAKHSLSFFAAPSLCRQRPVDPGLPDPEGSLVKSLPGTNLASDSSHSLSAAANRDNANRECSCMQQLLSGT